jgi:tetratricopeptide (TPR) repeat protein
MKKVLVCCAAALAVLGGNAQAESYCGELKNHYGPFDYRKRGQANLEIVEEYHFTEKVEAGIGGESGYIGGDLDYTLRAIPNHHRALATIGNLSLRTKTIQLQGARYPTECYFERAIRFAPDDGVARGAYGNFLFASGKTDKAISMFNAAIELEPNNPTINYNLGLLYLKVKNYDKASIYADKAYALGFPLPGLRNQLAEARKAGK